MVKLTFFPEARVMQRDSLKSNSCQRRPLENSNNDGFGFSFPLILTQPNEQSQCVGGVSSGNPGSAHYSEVLR